MNKGDRTYEISKLVGCFYCRRTVDKNGNALDGYAYPGQVDHGKGWGICEDCSDMRVNRHTRVYVQPHVLAAIHNGTFRNSKAKMRKLASLGKKTLKSLR